MATRLEKREIIFDTAQKLFLQNGLFNTTMDQIAEASGLSRRTLYRYFDKREDLAYEVTTQFILQWNQFFESCYSQLHGTGIERLEQFLKGLMGYMSERVEVMRYLDEFDFYFRDTASIYPSEKQIRHFKDVILVSDNYLKLLLKLGVEDGSIDDEINIEMTEATISNVMWSFGQRVASRGKIIEEETGYDPIKLIEHQVVLYIKALSI